MDDGRHIVVADIGGDHRVWLRDTTKGRRLAFVIAPDSRFPLRLAMAQRFERRMRGLPGGPLPSASRPTTLQRGKLTLLINLLDAQRARASRREMAAALIYPGISPLSGAEWKGSNERRRTLRLIEEARRLMAGAYRTLLGGA